MAAVISIIWKIIGPTLVNLAITWGLPKAMEFLISKGLPKWLVDGVLALIKEALDQIDGIDENLPLPQRKAQAKEIRLAAAKKARSLSGQVGRPADTKGLG